MLVIMELPLVVLNLVFGLTPPDRWESWAVVLVMDWIYFFVLVVAFRLIIHIARAQFSLHE